jgi:UDP-N-acetylglucosamine/UDP-N-acetylgalactosamine diphosphorylase
MAETENVEHRYRACRASLAPRGQEHALRWWPELASDERKQLLEDIESIPWGILDGIIESHVVCRPGTTAPEDLAPAPVYPRTPGPERAAEYRAATEQGRHLLATGKVAAFTVAGGQGTRLGVDGPKGAVIVTPVGNKTLFQLFAETVLAARRKYGAAIPWYIMTSPANHEETVEFLSAHDFFGLPKEDVILFPQGMLPAFDPSGRLLLAARHRLALAPDGHGGSLKALVTGGALRDMRSRGIEFISYFQVDNPLVKPFDPLLVGLHAQTGSEMSTKVTPKADDLERVGNVCLSGGKVTVIEYSDFPNELAHAKNADGSRTFDAGNLAIHMLNVDFVDRIVGDSFQMPLRRADKAVAYVDESGAVQTPASPNAVKLEAFIFDALPLAQNPLVLEVDRAEEFSPVKNATGVDSLESSQRDQVARACRWLESAGVAVPRRPDGRPDVTVVISPTFALDADDVRRQADRLPALNPGDAVCIE